MPTIPNAMQSLNAAVLSDTLDSLALMQQAMKPFMRPLDDTLQLIGRARTGLYMPVYAPPAKGENPYEVEIALVDDLALGDVVVLACDGPTERIAPWGELLSTACMARGGAVSPRATGYGPGRRSTFPPWNTFVLGWTIRSDGRGRGSLDPPSTSDQCKD